MKKYSTTHLRSLMGRRVRNCAATIVLLILLAVLLVFLNQNLWHASFASGYVLLASLLFLTAFNLRKRLTFLPQLGSAAMWMQLHIYVGLSTFVMFGFHVSWRIPNGVFESVLSILYLIVAFSGVYGLYVTRVVPRRLTALGDEVLFEKIPFLRQQLAGQARSLAIAATQRSDVVGKFYVNKLATFFERPRSLAYAINPSGRQRRQLMAELQDLDRYLAEDQRHVGRQLSTMVQKKDDLDYHRAMQGRLKLWLFAHIGFTYSLLIFSIMHGIMAHAFAGSLR